jgi:hypothetical protein
MILHSLLIAFLVVFAPVFAGHSSPLSFATLMGKTSQAKHKPRHLPRKDRSLFRRLERSYENNIKFLTGAPLNHIPHTMHLIWIGPKPFPEESIPNVQSFRDHHPEWTMNFWTDSPDRPMPIPGMVQRLVTNEYFQAVMDLYTTSTNYAEKADLLRCVILQKEGGLYFDHDAACLKSFDGFADHFDFVVACERIQYHEGMNGFIAPAIGLFLSRPDHPILQQFVDLAHQRWNTVPTYPKGEEWRGVIYRTFDSFALATMQQNSIGGNRDLILPTAYFYPNLAFKPPFVKRLRKEGYVYSVHGKAGTWRLH